MFLLSYYIFLVLARIDVPVVQDAFFKLASMHVQLDSHYVQLARIDVSVGQDAFFSLANMHVQLDSQCV